MAVDARFPFTTEAVPEFGRVIYRVAKVGALTLGFEDHYHLYKREGHGTDSGALLLVYGAHRTFYRSDWNPLEEFPSIYGVALGGGAVFDREKALEWHHTPVEERGVCRWLVCRRQQKNGYGGGCAPQATNDRAGHIVAALVEDFLSRPDLGDLHLAHRRAHAPGRWHGHRANITRLQKEIATREAEMAEEMARADDLVDLLPTDLLVPADASTLV